MKSLINKQQQAGLSLIELMVALVLSMLLMLGVTQVFLSSKATYSANQELSEIQESGRFALDILVQDIANTGYQGQCYRSSELDEINGPNEELNKANIKRYQEICKDKYSKVTAENSVVPESNYAVCYPINHFITNLDKVLPKSIWTFKQGAIFGWSKDNTPDSIQVPAGSEGLFIQFGAGGGRYSRTDESPNDTDSKINLDQSFQGRTVLISNGKSCDLFENVVDEDSVDSNYIKKQSDYKWSSKYEDEFGFDKGFELLEFKSIAYYVDKDEDNNNTPTLYRASYNYDDKNGSPELLPLVPGVKSIELEYGVIKDRSNKLNKKGGNVLSIDKYIKADHEDFSSSYKWDDVAAVKVKLTIKAESGLEKNFSSVVVLRNRL